MDPFNFKKIPDGTEFSDVFKENFFYFQKLQEIVKGCGGPKEESYLTLENSLNYNPDFYNKQVSLYNIAKNRKSIIEIGMGAGHSLLIMLLANKEAVFNVFDTCRYPYTIPCFNFLNIMFDDRIFLHAGVPCTSYKNFMQMNRKVYDLVNINNLNYISDNILISTFLFSNYEIAHIVISNYNLVKKEADKYEERGVIKLVSSQDEIRIYEFIPKN